MWKRRPWYLLIAALALSVAADSEFDAYPPEPRLTTAPAAPRLRTRQARRYRTVLREEAALGPNFNGHYRLAHWGCGTNCVEWAVIDLLSGEVWMAPRPLLSCAGSVSPDPGEPQDWFDARVTSSLLYVHSCRDDRGRVFDTRHVYRHAKGRLKLMRVEKQST